MGVPLLILRPEPGATMTSKSAWNQGGWRPLLAPIFRIERVDWEAPDPTGYDALIVTSANAVREAGTALRLYTGLPAFAVGAATARALKAADFPDIRTGRGDAAALLEILVEEGMTRALHLAGEDHRDATHPALQLDRRIVYRSAAVDKLTDGALRAMAGGEAVVLLHSGRAAEQFAMLSDRAGIARPTVALAALSPAILASAGEGWRATIAADKPDDLRLLAAAARLCQ
jgi:uroporphyrinogen-III synthase